MTFYIINRMSKSEFESISEKYKKEINEINSHWFRSSLERMSYYNKKVSILFALGFRMNLEQKKELLKIFRKDCIVREKDLRLIEYKWLG